MIETGVICSLSGGVISVKRFPSALGCFGCIRGECGKKADIITVENQAGFELAVGQRVETEIPLRQALIQAFMVCCPPLLGFTAGYLLGGVLAPASGDPLRAACGVLGLFASALIFYGFRRRFPPRALPRIVRVLD